MNTFFEEEVIPTWLETVGNEKDEHFGIRRFVSVYEELFLNVPKLLASFAKNDDDSSDEEDNGETNNDCAVTLSPSR